MLTVPPFLFTIFILWGIIEVLFFLTHRHPLDRNEIEKLSEKRARRFIKNNYNHFSHGFITPDKYFKGSLNGKGGWYPVNIPLYSFPSYVAGLLKWKKNEWVVFGFVKDKTVEIIYANRGEKEQVCPNLDIEEAIRVCKQRHYQTIIRAHNHPNSYPQIQSMLGPSDQDMLSSAFLSSVANAAGISSLDIVCERGSFHIFNKRISNDFKQTNALIESIEKQNDQSSIRNYLLHRELGILSTAESDLGSLFKHSSQELASCSSKTDKTHNHFIGSFIFLLSLIIAFVVVLVSFVNCINTKQISNPSLKKTEVTQNAVSKKEYGSSTLLASSEDLTDGYRIVQYGRCEQDNDLENGTEEIEWYVIARTEEASLLLSRYCLDSMPYYQNYSEVYWENSSIRAWLNGPFYETAFNDEEKDRIINVSLDNISNAKYGTEGGEQTRDMIFLLSLDEVSKTISDSDIIKAIGTKYAIKTGIGTGTTCAWWLRSPGKDNYYAAFFERDIRPGGARVDSKAYGIRPAMWIKNDECAPYTMNTPIVLADIKTIYGFSVPRIP